MTPSNPPQPKSPLSSEDGLQQALIKTTSFYCTALLNQVSDLLQVDYAAVAKCVGISERQAQRHFYWLKTKIASYGNATLTQAEKQGQGQNDGQDGQDGNDS
ncbi:hypothetical protein CBS147339_4830 [Penicillium roqueforti]|uniref:Genomic scaffold, ProqFM164S03 n=1 Tax=Penicillium roqueforti (strain FM164) TaxID=1365484 RepID=W6QDK4_PENRF|nr:hypothetical protein DTO012A8_5303 [Penicillium roqueforti]KAI3076860.1 hypothetical protein CBS147339_4830 [Penicillium roqueforti]KAI3092691.1 hypothetical protein CBS147338_7605 [Penicillium roqueforti]KAI3186886.1 hypothetical protein DTO032C6_4376 [Penicillium roqueforti]CDM34570.1 unnamed protein product [Penicillium roqueforti FM164]